MSRSRKSGGARFAGPGIVPWPGAGKPTGGRCEIVHFVLFCMDLRSARRLNLAHVKLVWRFEGYNLIVLLARRNSGPATGVRVGAPPRVRRRGGGA